MKVKPLRLEANDRIKHFKEVNRGYDEENAVKEAERCLQCKNASCSVECPIGVNIPYFINLIREQKFSEAAHEIKKTNPFPRICARVCPQESLCESACILSNDNKSLSIGHLARFAADKLDSYKPVKKKKNKKKVAIIGSGPAGLTAAHDLAILGYNVTVFEALSKPGGVLTYGIPSFRLPKSIVQKEIQSIKELGVDILTNVVIGKLYNKEELKKKFDAIFISCGAGLPSLMEIPGINLNNVYSANEFLTRVNLMKAHHFPKFKTPVHKGSKTIVVGGGNVAIDAARIARRFGADVTVVYRRSSKEMKARKQEIEHAQEEGIHFMLLTNPVKIIGKKDVEAVECIQMMLGEADKDGRRKPIPIEGSEFRMECDQIIMAIGQGPNPLITRTIKLNHDVKGHIIVDEYLHTSEDGIFAGGDIITGDTTVIKAIADGKKATRSIDEYIKSRE